MTLNLTLDQKLGLLRQLLPIVGTILAAMGWIDPNDWETWSQVILKLAGPLTIFGSAVWTIIANNKTSMVKSVAAMNETSVSPAGGTITIHDSGLAKAAMQAATPPTNGHT